MPCGIYHPARASWLPLASLSISADILDTSCRTILTQTFVNPLKAGTIENATYVFPLYGLCTVVGFRCFIGERFIYGVVKENGSMTAGDPVADVPSRDSFSTELGTIFAEEMIRVEIEYVLELRHDRAFDGLVFTIPMNLAPKHEDLPDAVQNKGLHISIRITTPSNIRSVESPTHPVSVYLGGHSEDMSKASSNPKLALAVFNDQQSTALDSHFVLVVKCTTSYFSHAFLETHPTIPNSIALMITLAPNFTFPHRPKPEIVFVADRSGSMLGRMAALKSALSVFLRSLPVGIKFNICSFGSYHSFLWESSQPYSADTLDLAERHAQSMEANYVSTVLLGPVQAVIEKRDQGIPLDIVVLTDGDVSDPETLLEYIDEVTAPGDIRVFFLGIGRDVSLEMAGGMSRAGRGLAHIVRDESDGFEGKVVQMLRAGLTDHVRYQLEWGEGSAFPAFMQAPPNIPPLIPSSPTTVYAILSDRTPPTSVCLYGTTPWGEHDQFEIPIDVSPNQSCTIHQLAAQRVLQELEEDPGYLCGGTFAIGDPTLASRQKIEGTRIGLRYEVASKWTSYAVVERMDGSNGSPDGEQMLSVSKTISSNMSTYGSPRGAGGPTFQPPAGTSAASSSFANVQPLVESENVARGQCRVLITLQNFEGYFPFSPALATALCIPIGILQGRWIAFQEQTGVALGTEIGWRFWGTLLAVQFFEGALGCERDMWELVVEKAKAWIATVDVGLRDDDLKRLQDVCVPETLGMPPSLHVASSVRVVPSQPVAGHNGSPSTSHRPAIPSTAVPRSPHRTQHPLYPRSLRAAIISIISPHPSPSVHHSNKLQMNHPRKVRPTGWTVRSTNNGQHGWPIHALCFFLGFLMPPLWWVASFLKIPRPRTIEGRDPEKSEMPDDLQVEFDSISWRTRCRIMAFVSLLTYVPFIVLIIVFKRRNHRMSRA